MTRINQLVAAELEAAFQGRNILVIGGTAGIGKAIAVACLQRGAHVTIVGRREPGPELSSAKYVQKDLSLMKNALALADEVDIAELDTVVFTNGIFANRSRQVNSEGIELDLAVSYLSRFVFVRSLINKGFGSRRSDTTRKPRIFVMGYPGVSNTATLDDFNSERNYSTMTAHMNTVVANEALVLYLNEALKGTANAYGLNPGLIRTEIRDNLLGKGSWLSWVMEGMIGLFTKSAETYVESTVISVLASPQLEDQPGLNIDSSRRVIAQNPFLKESKNVQRLIEESTKLADIALTSSTSS